MGFNVSFKVFNKDGIDVTKQYRWYLNSDGELYYAEGCRIIHTDDYRFELTIS